jgi:hypothetical protein
MLLGIGLLLVSAGLLAMTAVTPTSGWTTLIPGFVLSGAGIGLINPPLASTAVGVVHYSRSGMASGINNTFRQVGIATGIAGLGAVFQHDIVRNTLSALAGSAVPTHGLNTVLVSGGLGHYAASMPVSTRATLVHAYHVGFVEAFTSILLIAVAIAFVGAVCAFALVRASDFVAQEGAAESEPAVAAA